MIRNKPKTDVSSTDKFQTSVYNLLQSNLENDIFKKQTKESYFTQSKLFYGHDYPGVRAKFNYSWAYEHAIVSTINLMCYTNALGAEYCLHTNIRGKPCDCYRDHWSFVLMFSKSVSRIPIFFFIRLWALIYEKMCMSLVCQKTKKREAYRSVLMGFLQQVRFFDSRVAS